MTNSSENNNETEMLFNLSTDLLCIVKPDGCFERVSPSFIKTLGYTEEELTNTPFIEFVHPDDVESTNKEAARLLEGKSTPNFENRYRHKDGHYLIFSWSSYGNPENGKLYAAARDITEKRNAENELMHIQNALHAETILAKTDPVGKIIEVNDKFCEISGYNRDELIGQTHSIVNSGKHSEAFFKDMWTTISSGKTWTGMIENKKKNGEHYFVQSIITPIKDHNDEIINYLAIRFDATEHVATENELSNLTDILNETSSIAKVGGWELDIATEELIWTNETFKILEVEKRKDQKPMLPEGLELFTDSSKPIIDRAVSRAIEFGEPYSLELEAKTAKGNVLWVYTNGRPNYDEQGNIVTLSGTIQDIHARKMAEIELFKSRQRYRDIVEGSEDLITIIGSDGKFKFANHMSKKIYGISPEECIGKHAIDFVYEEDLKSDQEKFQKIQKEKLKIATHESRQKSASGEIRDVSWHIAVQYNEDGNFESLISIGRDVTEHNKMDRELKKALSDANIASQAKSDFLSTMSHEIRTPISGIIGMTSLLSKTELDDQQQNFVNMIQNSGDSLLTLVNDTLDLSKIEAGDFELEELVFDLNNTINSITHTYKHLCNEADLSFNLEMDTKKALIAKGDQNRFLQILRNLLGNALKFTNAGSISLKVEQLSIDNPLSLNDLDYTIKMEVTDTGKGIPEDRQEMIFESFTQEDSSITRKFGGTGLGLTIVKNLCKIMGGTVSLNSQIDQGSTFTVILPFKKPSQKEIEKLEEDNNFVLDTTFSRTLNILVAEDNEVNKLIIQEHLRNMGHNVEIANNGLEALNAVEAGTNYDLILMDIHMPEMDGVEATTAIRKLPNGENVPIVALTAEVFVERIKFFKNAGINDVLTKPYSEKLLVRILQDVADNQRITQITSDTVESIEFSDLKNIPIGDIQSMNKLRNKVPQEKLLKIITSAQNSLKKSMLDLEEALKENDEEAIRLITHKIKGSSGSFYAARLSKIAGLIQFNHQDKEKVNELFPIMKDSAEKTISWWQSL